MSFFKFGVMVSVHREYDEVDKVVLTTFENGNRFEGMFEGTKLGDHYLSLQARWGFPEARTEQPDQWFDLYQWKIKGHPVVVQVWNRGTDDPSFGYIKEQTVKRIEILRKHERWE